MCVLHWRLLAKAYLIRETSTHNSIHRSMLHTSEENSGASLITHQSMEFSHIDVNLEFAIRTKIISYTSTIASPL